MHANLNSFGRLGPLTQVVFCSYGHKNIFLLLQTVKFSLGVISPYVLYLFDIQAYPLGRVSLVFQLTSVIAYKIGANISTLLGVFVDPANYGFQGTTYLLVQYLKVGLVNKDIKLLFSTGLKFPMPVVLWFLRTLGLQKKETHLPQCNVEQHSVE